MRIEQETVLLFIGQDIMLYVRSEERRVQSERLAAIGQTVASISHEARNDLAALHMIVDVLESSPEYPRTQPIILEMRHVVTHLTVLLEDVRSFAAPIVLNRLQLTVADIWRRAWTSLRPRTEGRSVRIVEQSDQNTRALVDGFRLEQVFRNVFENSLSICPEPLCVEVLCERLDTERLLQITLRNNGPGISPQIRDRNFEPFSITRSEGTGLGMAICKRIVETHGGSLEVPNERGLGAAFCIQLPTR